MLTDSNLPTTIACLRRAEAYRDVGTNSHEHRVAQAVFKLACHLGLDEDEACDIARASILHDIGKLAVPLALLHKPGALSANEIAWIKTHSANGHKILASPGDTMVELAASIALNHHEHYDGTGYPHGKRGEDIPLPAQIVAICDIYDALRDDRPYRAGVTHETAMGIIVIGDSRTKPTHFAPRVWQAFQQIGDDACQLFEAA